MSEAERDRARTLDWTAFDQRGGATGSFRELSNKECYEEAIAAYRDWLANGVGFANARESGVGHLHMAQTLGYLGRNEEALTLLNSAYRDEAGGDPGALEWNIYIAGLKAFFEGDPTGIDRALTKLSAIDNPRADRWRVSLGALERCFGESYYEATSMRCRTE